MSIKNSKATSSKSGQHSNASRAKRAKGHSNMRHQVEIDGHATSARRTTTLTAKPEQIPDAIRTRIIEHWERTGPNAQLADALKKFSAGQGCWSGAAPLRLNVTLNRVRN